MTLKQGITAITPVGKYWNPEWLHRAGESINGVVDQWIIICDGANFHEVSQTINDSPFKGSLGVMMLDLFSYPAGQAQARNVALKFVTTEYVYALDADDFVDTEAFRKFAQQTMESKFIWGASPYIEVDSNEDLIFSPASIKEWDAQGTVPKSGFLDFYEDNGFYPVKGNGSAILSTELAREVGGWDETVANLSEGESLLAGISEREEGYWNPENVFKKRRHENSDFYRQNQHPDYTKRAYYAVEQMFERARPGYQMSDALRENLNYRYLY